MKLLSYSHDYDHVVLHWLKQHGHIENVIDELPEIGYIATEQGFPVAVGFLRKVEPTYGILDSFCTNPKAAGQYRHVAMQLLIDKCLRTAKQLEMTHCLALCIDKSPIMRALKTGFIMAPHVVLSFNLKDFN